MGDVFPGPAIAALEGEPGRVALEQGGRTVSCGELLDMVRRITSGLRDAGAGPGTRIGLVLSLSPEAYATHLAAHALGCLVAPARPGWSRDQLVAAMRKLDMIVADNDIGLPALALDDLLNHPAGEVPELGRANDLGRLIYTSGSTGTPKACAHTYQAISLAYQTHAWPPPLTRLMTHFGRYLAHNSFAMPVHFTYLGRCLVAGGTGVLCDDLPPGEAIERYRITATVMTPPKLGQVLRTDPDLSSLRALVLGGSPASPQLLHAVTERLGPIVWQGYGQGEAGIVSMLTPEDIAAGHVTSVGRPVPAVEVSIRDGEVCVRSPHMMSCYLDDPVQTAEVLRDGWLHTRDLGHLGDDGMLYLTGRSRDVIMVNAEVCYAGAIERVLTGHPAVAQAYVVGGPDAVTGEAVHAFLVPAEGSDPDPDALRDLVRERLGRNSVPKTVTLIRDVPVGASGKPDKQALMG